MGKFKIKTYLDSLWIGTFTFFFYPFDLFSTVSTLFYLAILTLGGRVFLSQQDIVLKSPLTQDELGVPIDKIMKIMPARIVIRIQITPVKSLHLDDNIKLEVTRGQTYMQKMCDVAEMAILAKKIGGKSA